MLQSRERNDPEHVLDSLSILWPNMFFVNPTVRQWWILIIFQIPMMLHIQASIICFLQVLPEWLVGWLLPFLNAFDASLNSSCFSHFIALQQAILTLIVILVLGPRPAPFAIFMFAAVSNIITIGHRLFTVRFLARVKFTVLRVGEGVVGAVWLRAGGSIVITWAIISRRITVIRWRIHMEQRVVYAEYIA